MSGQILRSMGRDVPPAAQDIDSEEYINWLAAQNSEPRYTPAYVSESMAQLNRDKRDKLESIAIGRITHTGMHNGYVLVYFDRPVSAGARSSMWTVAGTDAMATNNPNCVAFKL